jgi:hypothetical protein
MCMCMKRERESLRERERVVFKTTINIVVSIYLNIGVKFIFLY